MKEVRLKQFQEDVKRRVTELARLKRQHELQKTYKDVSLSEKQFPLAFVSCIRSSCVSSLEDLPEHACSGQKLKLSLVWIACSGFCIPSRHCVENSGSGRG